jgi:hypothetical protein
LVTVVKWLDKNNQISVAKHSPRLLAVNQLLNNFVNVTKALVASTNYFSYSVRCRKNSSNAEQPSLETMALTVL